MKINIDLELELKGYQKRALIVVGIILIIAGIVTFSILFPWVGYNDIASTIGMNFFIFAMIIFVGFVIYFLIDWIKNGSFGDE